MRCVMFGVLFLSVTAFGATDYQKEIDKQFPGFIALTKSEFNPEFIKSENPGLITGKFNPDQMKDFAAIVRDKTKKRYEARENSYDYYDGKVVSCLGQPKGGYKCQVISKMPFTIPQQSYLTTATPQKTGCYNDKGEKDSVDVKTDAIGWYYPEKGGSHYIYQADGTYRNCVTSD